MMIWAKYPVFKYLDPLGVYNACMDLRVRDIFIGLALAAAAFC